MSIQITDITYIYMKDTPFEKVALNHVSLEISKGEFVAIIGHTGSGKSTLMQLLNGLLKPTKGQVKIDGVDLSYKTVEAKQARRKVGMVFQYPEYQLFEETIYDDIAFGPRNLGLSEKETEDRVRKAMQFVNLDFNIYKHRSPFQLSGGQMRRVAIAGVIALEPDYLILDEPAAGLDPCGRDDIFSRIVELHKVTNMAVVLVSHNMDDVAKMATRLIVMNEGRIFIDGDTNTVFADAGKLQLAGVSLPHLKIVLEKIKESGFDLSTDALTSAIAAREIFKAIRGKENAD